MKDFILTFVNNSYSIVKEHIRRVSFLLYPSRLKLISACRFGCILRALSIPTAKLQHYNHICKYYLVKKCKHTKKSYFTPVLGVLRALPVM